MQPSLNWFHRFLLQACKGGGVPNHIAFIMDGNRRFVKQSRGALTSAIEGHSMGFDTLLLALEVCYELGVKSVTVYAFSEENFRRPKEEVDALLELAKTKFAEFLNAEHLIMKRGIVVDILGRCELLPKDLQSAAARVVLGTRKNTGNARLNICLAYSGVVEIKTAMRRISLALLAGEISSGDVDSALIGKCTYLPREDDGVDLLIRTSGETRLSDFLLWHLGNAKLVFVDALWPELSVWHLLACIIDWQASRVEEEQRAIPPRNARVQAFIRRIQVERLVYWQSL